MDVLVVVALVLAVGGLGLLIGRLLGVRDDATVHGDNVDPVSVEAQAKQGQGPDDEWPELIGTEASSSGEVSGLTEDERLQLAVIQERILRLIR